MLRPAGERYLPAAAHTNSQTICHKQSGSISCCCSFKANEGIDCDSCNVTPINVLIVRDASAARRPLRMQLSRFKHSTSSLSLGCNFSTSTGTQVRTATICLADRASALCVLPRNFCLKVQSSSDMWHASAGEFTRVMTWLPNSQELVFAAGNVIVIMHSESLCMQACNYYVCL